MVAKKKSKKIIRKKSTARKTTKTRKVVKIKKKKRQTSPKFFSLYKKHSKAIRLSYALSKLRTGIKIKKIISFLNDRANQEVTIFEDSVCPITFKPFLYKQGLVFLFIFVVLGSFLIPRPTLNEALVIDKATIKQNTTVVADGSTVKWTAFVNKADITNSQYLLQLPKLAENIKISAITRDLANQIVNSDKKETPLSQKFKIAVVNQPKSFYIADLANNLSRLMVSDFKKGAQVIISAVNDQVQTLGNSKIINLSDKSIATKGLSGLITDNMIKIDYETSAPQITEEETSNGKLITVSSYEKIQNPAQEQVPLTDVVVFTKIPEIYKVGQEVNIKMEWVNNGNQEVPFKAYDTDNNGALDYIEWTVPHLSTQTFKVIFISKEFILNSVKDTIGNIFGK